jgi:hypothetical protein
MKRFLAPASGWRGGVLVGALLAAIALAGPAAAKNTNLTATAKYSASTEWQHDQNNPNFVASKAFDGDLSTRWNSDSGDEGGSWLAATWDQPVTVNKVVMYERFSRVTAFSVQQLDSGGNWATVYEAHDAKYQAAIKNRSGGDLTFSIRLDKPFTSKGMRILFDEVTAVPSIAELEAWNNPAGTLTGTVKDPNGKPVEGATVRAGADATTTDNQGAFSLVTDAGKYNVTAGKTGAFRDRIARAVDIPANGAEKHDFVLLPLPTNLSLTATAVSSSNWEDGTDYDAPKAKDGSLATRWNSRADDANGSYLEMQWAQPQTFNKVTIREFDDRIRNYSLQSYNKSNDAYVDIPEAKNVKVLKTSGDRTFTHIFSQPVTSERLRLLVNDTDSTSLSVYELEVANAPVASANVTVTDVASGNPVPNATISSDLGVVVGTTNDKGQASLLLEPDDYVLSATAAGYFGGQPVPFTLNAGDKQDIKLTAPAQGADIARTGKAISSGDDGTDLTANINDGDPDTFWTAGDVVNQWVGVQWDKPQHLTVVQIRGFHAAIQRSYLEYLDTDGKTWKTREETTFAPQFLAGKPADFLFPEGITTTGLRYFITATDSATSAPGVGELIIFDSPIPKP